MKLSNTNWNLYKSFTVVYETKNFSRAAGILNISRQAVSKNIRELGDQIGAVLFSPTAKGIQPTLDAQNVYPKIKNAVDSIIGAENAIGTFDAQSTGVIKIAFPSSTAELFIKDYLQQFRQSYPNVNLELSRGDSIELLAQRKMDIVIDLDYFFTHANIKTISLFDVHSTFAATKNFLSERGIGTQFTKDQLLALPIVVYSKTWDYFYKYNNIQTESTIIRTNSTDLNFSIMKNCIAVGYLGYYRKDIIGDPDLVELQVSGINIPAAKMVCGYSKDPTRATQAFVDGLVKFCRVNTKA